MKSTQYLRSLIVAVPGLLALASLAAAAPAPLAGPTTEVIVQAQDVAACAISGDWAELDGKKFTWQLSNQGGASATVAGIHLGWPSANGVLKKIKLDGDEISKQEVMPPAATLVSGWHDDTQRPPAGCRADGGADARVRRGRELRPERLHAVREL